jgi:hypothetical protein
LGVLVLHHSSNCFLVRLRRADYDQTHRKPGRLRVPRLRIFLVACQAFAPRGEGNGLGFEKLPVEFSRKLQASRWVRRCDGSEVSVAKIRIRFEKVRMVESVEQLEAELESLGLGQLPPFL